MYTLASPRRSNLPIICAVAVALLSLRAEDAPAGQRVFYTGHSFHMFVPPRVNQLAKSAGILTHKTAGAQSIGGSKVIQHWELADEKNSAKPALTGGQIDVFTMAAHLAIPDAGIDNFVELGLKHNANMRFLIQASWAPYDSITAETRIKDTAERDATDLDALQTATSEWRKKMEAQTDALNQKHARKAVFIVPVGDAVVALRRRIKAGEFPGVAKPSELFTDPIGHGKGHIQALTAYCNFAAIYRRSPAGLKLSEQGVSEDQHAILQRIAWDTVSKYSHAGVETK